MTNEEVLKKIIEEKYQNVKAFSEKINIPYTTVRSILERGLLNAKVENVIRIYIFILKNSLKIVS